jgi:class 3 adenylate cyclase
MRPSETSYAVRPDGVNLAYQVIGDGPLTLLCCWGFISHLDLLWTDPGAARFYRGLASFARVVMFDKAGTGLSDPIPRVATLEERAEDIRVVMDAAGVERAALLGESEGAPSAMLFATTHPERTTSLVLVGPLVKGLSDHPEEEPWALTTEGAARFDELVAQWGKGTSIDLFAPSQVSALGRMRYATFERTAVSPSMARALVAAIKAIDVSDVAAAVSVPTLVIHARGDQAVPVAAGRFLAATIPEAAYVELDSDDHAYNAEPLQGILAATEQFLTGRATSVEPDRALVTILFTDIVRSTERAAEIGDAAWRDLLGRHDDLVRAHVQSAGGTLVKTLGDGVLCTLPGPARAVRCARDLIADTEDLGLAVRTGIHTGECERIGDDIGGLAVHIGARIAAAARPSEILVSSTVRDLVVGSELRFDDRGEHELKGVPGAWRLYAFADDRPESQPVDGAQDHMTVGDRAILNLARRAPGLSRALNRITGA